MSDIASVRGPANPAASSAARVLVVDDEAPLVHLLTGYLERAGFAVRPAYDGQAALAQTRSWDPDVILLDLALPGVDGVEVCRRVREFSDCYVLMLTARVEEVDRLIGLAVGADDYVTKPFSPREVVARVQAMLRRPRGGIRASQGARAAGAVPARGAAATARDVVRLGDLVVDRRARELRVRGRLVDLTRTEFDLLAELVMHPRQVFTRAQLMQAVAGPGWVGDEHAVDVHVGHIRRKIGDDPAGRGHIRTVRGVGYRMEAHA